MRMSQQMLDSLPDWHRMVLAAWLTRSLPESDRRHPNMAARIFDRYEHIITPALEH